ncbi:hypothetical protein [Spartinivicinus ruber]|uniref:hypothetical protein n=1 Tax=Spartinivicinus ruber TaxID=2683272 RepID=UPI0013D179A0|nr:hypothetical protein [Spartinivicinus ruber]
MQRYLRLFFVFSVALLSGAAFAEGDTPTLTSGISFDGVLAQITTVAIALAAFYVGRKGIYLVLDMLRSKN